MRLPIYNNGCLLQETTNTNNSHTSPRPSNSNNSPRDSSHPLSKLRRRHRRGQFHSMSISSLPLPRPSSGGKARRATVHVTHSPPSPPPKPSPPAKPRRKKKRSHKHSLPTPSQGSPTKKRLDTLGFVVPTWEQQPGEHVNENARDKSAPSTKHTFTKTRDRLDVEYDKGKLPKRKPKRTTHTSGRNPFQNAANKNNRQKRSRQFV